MGGQANHLYKKNSFVTHGVHPLADQKKTGPALQIEILDEMTSGIKFMETDGQEKVNSTGEELSVSC